MALVEKSIPDQEQKTSLIVLFINKLRRTADYEDRFTQGSNDR